MGVPHKAATTGSCGLQLAAVAGAVMGPQVQHAGAVVGVGAGRETDAPAAGGGFSARLQRVWRVAWTPHAALQQPHEVQAAPQAGLAAWELHYLAGATVHVVAAAFEPLATTASTAAHIRDSDAGGMVCKARMAAREQGNPATFWSNASVSIAAGDNCEPDAEADASQSPGSQAKLSA